MPIEELQPLAKPRIMDLVELTGIDVGPWAFRADGSLVEHPAANPAYCYEWCFADSCNESSSAFGSTTWRSRVAGFSSASICATFVGVIPNVPSTSTRERGQRTCGERWLLIPLCSLRSRRDCPFA